MNKEKLSPYEVDFLMWAYYAAEKHERSGSEMFKQTATKFILVGAVRERDKGKANENEFELTALGRAWVESILETPMPKLVFVDPRSNEVIEIE